MAKTILITGCAGFIGFHLARALKKRGDFVVGFDNFNAYYSPQLKRDREKELNCPIIEGDLEDRETLLDAVKKNNVTHIVNLAAQAGVRTSLETPQTYIDSNITGFLNVLEVCREFPHIPLTYASSSSVYGLNTEMPFAIDDTTDRQASLYGVTKKTNELMANAYHHLFKIKATGLRFFTVYGPWGRPDMAYMKFTDSILRDLPIDIYNNGELQRDFTYIDDIVEGTIAAIDKESPLALYNLGNNKPVPLMTFIETLEEALGKKARKNYLPMQKGDVFATFAAIEKSQKELNFFPKTPLKEGMEKFVSWYENYLSLCKKI